MSDAVCPSPGETATASLLTTLSAGQHPGKRFRRPTVAWSPEQQVRGAAVSRAVVYKKESEDEVGS